MRFQLSIDGGPLCSMSEAEYIADIKELYGSILPIEDVKPDYMGRRDLSYSQWHRSRLPRDCPMTDVDGLRYKFEDSEPVILAVEETKRASNKPYDSSSQSKVLQLLAKTIGVPYRFVIYDPMKASEEDGDLPIIHCLNEIMRLQNVVDNCNSPKLIEKSQIAIKAIWQTLTTIHSKNLINKIIYDNPSITRMP